MINWENIKKKIKYDLESKERVNGRVKELKTPRRRLNALKQIENILNAYFPEIISKPSLLDGIDKNEFKKRLSKYKKLSAAESSIINSIYDLVK